MPRVRRWPRTSKPSAVTWDEETGRRAASRLTRPRQRGGERRERPRQLLGVRVPNAFQLARQRVFDRRAMSRPEVTENVGRESVKAAATLSSQENDAAATAIRDLCFDRFDDQKQRIGSRHRPVEGMGPFMEGVGNSRPPSLLRRVVQQINVPGGGLPSLRPYGERTGARVIPSAIAGLLQGCR